MLMDSNDLLIPISDFQKMEIPGLARKISAFNLRKENSPKEIFNSFKKPLDEISFSKEDCKKLRETLKSRFHNTYCFILDKDAEMDRKVLVVWPYGESLNTSALDFDDDVPVVFDLRHIVIIPVD